MPPGRFSKPQTTQTSIKDMLKAKRPNPKVNQEPHEESNRIPDYLKQHVDILPPPWPQTPDYEVSKLALQYFRQHSNINDLKDDYMVGQYPIAEDSITSQMVRCAVSLPGKRIFKPFNKFRYESSYHETVAKALLIYPGIKDEATLNLYLQYQNKYNLKLPLVNMLQNNEVHSGALMYFERKKALQKTEGFPSTTNKANARDVLMKYYERESLQETVYLSDITVQTLERISNFKRVMAKEMIKLGTSPLLYDAITTKMLADAKKNPSMLINLKTLFYHPKFNFIANILTVDQQNRIARSRENFYKLTNANRVRKKVFPEPTQAAFYELYVRRGDVDRKMPPFNKLLFIGEDESDESDDECLRPAALQYKTRPRFETNQEPPRIATPVNLDENSSDTSTSLATVLHDPSKAGPSHAPLTRQHQEKILPKPAILNSEDFPDLFGTPANIQEEQNQASPPSIEAVVQKKPEQLPDCYVDEDFELDKSCLSYDCIKVLLADSTFMKQAKNYLNEKFSKHFDIFWRTKCHVILTRFIIDLWSNDIEALKNFVANCQEHTQVKALEIINRHIRSQQGAAGLSLAQEQHESSNTSEEVELVTGLISIATVNQVQVKQEPLSQPRVFLNDDSDVICVGECVETEIVINESMDEDESLIQQLDANNQEPNFFLDQINEGTQSDELAEVPPGETTMRLRNYRLMSVEQLAFDKRELRSTSSPATSKTASSGAKRKVPFATVAASSKRRRNATPPDLRLEYIEESQADDSESARNS